MGQVKLLFTALASEPSMSEEMRRFGETTVLESKWQTVLLLMSEMSLSPLAFAVHFTLLIRMDDGFSTSIQMASFQSVDQYKKVYIGAQE
jgi:hypothetical protein